jgi:hypothetical protein
LNSPGAGLVESVFTFADQRRDGGVVERFAAFFEPDFAEAAFFEPDFAELDFEDDREVEVFDRAARLLVGIVLASVTEV